MILESYGLSTRQSLAATLATIFSTVVGVQLPMNDVIALPLITIYYRLSLATFDYRLQQLFFEKYVDDQLSI